MQLPNLGALAPTSGNADGKRPVKAARPAPAPAPPPLRLTGLPRDVIDLMVTQAARDARDAADPAGVICAWMKNFCKAAKVQGVAGCEDQWYRLALQAFGVPPDAPIPAQMWFNWRYLFAITCDKLHGPNAAAHVKQSGFPPEFRWNASQRELDWGLAMLLEKNVLERLHNNPSMVFDEARDIEKASWDALSDPADPRRKRAPSSQEAIAVLLVLKGAEPWADKKYRTLDNEIYTALNRKYEHEIDADEALRLIRDALDRGARVSQSGWKYHTITNRPTVIENTLYTAVISNAGTAIINLLLDRGAKTAKEQYPNIPYLTHSFLSNLAMESVEPYWSTDRATTERLIEAARPILRDIVLAHNAAKLGHNQRSIAAMSRAQGPPADWLTAAWKRLFDVTQWMDPRELEEHLPQMADYDPTAWYGPA